MPVSQAVATAQVRRFEKKYPSFPDAAGQLMLARAFREACYDDQHAIRVGDHLIRTLHFAPVPADIYDAVTALRNSDEGRIPEYRGLEYKCQACQDTGWEITPEGFATRCRACYKSVKPIRGAAAQ